MKKIIAINASPRKGWNTDKLVKAAGEGAKSSEGEVEYIELYNLEKYTGCISCFACKLPNTFGKCVYKDGLHDVLEKIRNADGLIIGSPNYLGNLTAGFRALYERLVFQVITYNEKKPNCNERKIPVLLITTSNCSEDMYDAVGYTSMLEDYKSTLSNFVGPTELLICGNTLQVQDYSRYDWTMFDSNAKHHHHDETFGKYLQRAFSMGKKL